jgi:hypothetical protein
VNLGVEGH